ncbi:hypothetical protein TNCV_2830461 [Trichonephila clavipes]|nr:hypothetical protein TNCV_2830461 [Trichonephila clavipes]
MRQLIAVTPDSADRKPVDTEVIPDGITHTVGIHRIPIKKKKSWTATSIAHDEIQWETTEQSTCGIIDILLAQKRK